MKSKITKFSILLKEVSRVQKKCVQICISYLAVIGFFIVAVYGIQGWDR